MEGVGGREREATGAIHSTNRSSIRKHLKRRKNRRFKGRKERLREEVKILKKEKEIVVKKNLVLSQRLQRYIELLTLAYL